MGKRQFCVKGGEIIGNVPTIEELAVYIKDYILNNGYSAEWQADEVKGATRKAIYEELELFKSNVVGQLEYKGVYLLSVDLVKVIIETHFNRYFRCKDIVNYVIADQEGVSLKFIMDCRKRYIDPFDGGRISLRGKVTWVLKGLESEGYIEKYNSKMWMVVK